MTKPIVHYMASSTQYNPLCGTKKSNLDGSWKRELVTCKDCKKHKTDIDLIAESVAAQIKVLVKKSKKS